MIYYWGGKMTLIEILQSQLKRLNKEYNDYDARDNQNYIQQLKQYRVTVEDTIDSLRRDIDDLLYAEIEQLGNILKDNLDDFDLKAYEKKLSHIYLVLKGKHDGLATDLTQEQRDFVNDLLTKLVTVDERIGRTLESVDQNNFAQQKRMEQLQDDIISYDDLIGKIKAGKSALDDEDLNLIYRTIITSPKIPNDTKKEVLIKFNSYNDNVQKREKVSIENVLAVFKEFTDDPYVEKIIKSNANEIMNNADIDNIREVLTSLKEAKLDGLDLSLLQRFKDEQLTLVTIAIYGNKESVEEQINRMIKRGSFDSGFFTMPSAWIVNDYKQESRRKRHNKKILLPQENHRLSTVAHQISADEIIENERFLLSKGFYASINDKKNMSILRRPNYHLKHSYEVLQQYGFFENRQDLSKFPISSLTTSNIEEKCDQLIELGLLHGDVSSSYGRTNYAHRYPSVLLRLNDDFLTIASYFKQMMNSQDYYETIFSNNLGFEGNLSSSFIASVASEKGRAKTEQINRENFISLSQNIPNYSLYNSIVENSISPSFDPAILDDEVVKTMENDFGVANNEYVYRVGDVVISRPKFLRNYSLLKENGIEKREGALLYCLTSGMKLTNDNFTSIKDDMVKKVK